MKKIKLTENALRKIVKESVKKVLKEAGESRRGQYQLGRLSKRQEKRNDPSSALRTSEYAYKANGNKRSDDYRNGYKDEAVYGRNPDSTWDSGSYMNIKRNYDWRKLDDMNNLGEKFIDFIEQYNGGVLLQKIVDYESGNETGTPQSPLKEIIPYFEDEVLGYECTPDMVKAIKRAYNEWWNYAESELIQGYDDEY